MRKFLIYLLLLSALPLTVCARTYQLEMLIYKQPAIGRDHESWQSHPVEPELKSFYPKANDVLAKDLFYYRRLLEKKTEILFQTAYQFDQNSIIKFDQSTDKIRLWGYLTIKLGYYIEISTDLLYEQMASMLPSTLSSQFDGVLAKFPLKDKRRLVPGVVYYYDHPLFGMLFKVNRV